LNGQRENGGVLNYLYTKTEELLKNNYKTGTPPLRGGVDGPPAGGVHLYQGGVLPPTGWLDKPLIESRLRFQLAFTNSLENSSHKRVFTSWKCFLPFIASVQ